jgi:hypothetical protein
VDTPEPTWQRQLLVGLSVLLVIAALVGVIVAGIAVKAADYLGVGHGHGGSTPAHVLPSTGNATKQEPTKHPQTSTPPTHHQTHTISLTETPATVGASAKINLSGQYPGGDGATLQIQRSIGTGPWADFPVTTHVTGGSFATYIETSYTGVNHIRVLDKATGKTSNVVTVVVTG